MNRRFLVVLLVFVASGVFLAALNVWHQSKFGTLAGRVVDADRRPVAGAEVVLVGRFGEERDPFEIEHRTRSDREGRFVVRSIVTGRYRLEVRADGLEKILEGLELEGERHTDLGDLELGPAGD